MINIDVTQGAFHIKDSFQWDLSNPDNSPEDFATVLVNDLTADRQYSKITDREIEILQQKVALEIRNQIDQTCLRHANESRTAL